MKSRTNVKAPKKIVGYCIKDENKQKLGACAKTLGAELSLLGTEAAGEKVGYAVGFAGFSADKDDVPEAPTDECIIFSGFDSKEVDTALDVFDESKLDIPLKAVVTAKNQRVSIAVLVVHLGLEKANMDNQ